MEPSEFTAIPGKGIIAKINNRKIMVGQIKLFEANMISEIWQKQIEDSNKNGMSTILLSIENELVAMFGFTDTIKPDAQNVIASLNNLRKNTILMSGDNNQVTKQVARSIGTQKYFPELYPTEKYLDL